MIHLHDTSRLLKALGDETRLRLLHLLGEEELTTSDLQEALNLGQSRVSAHLGHLKEVGLVRDRKAGRRTWYSPIEEGGAARLRDEVLARHRDGEEFVADLSSLDALRRRRQEQSRAYFDRVAATFGEELLPGRTWEGLARSILQLAPHARYADIGVGDGLLTLMIAEIAESVTAIDLSKEMLSQLKQRARAKGIENVVGIEGGMEDLPLPDASHDVAVLSQALHHAQIPSRALEEARRILAPGGKVLVIDLLAHNEVWVREKYEHIHLGFSESQLEELLIQAGFQDVAVHRVARDPQPPHFMTVVATASTSTS